MEIKFLNQPKEVKLGDLLLKRLSENFEKVWIVAGFAKDSGLDVLLPSIEEATQNGSAVELIVGIDAKNTSKDMLLKLLNMGCHIRVHMNKEDSKLETRVYAFESEKGDSYIYLTGAKLSEDGLSENMCMITEIVYGKEDKKEFNKIKISIENGANSQEIYELDAQKLKSLAERGEIASRITERKIPTISEMYKTNGANVEIGGANEYDEGSSTGTYSGAINNELDFEIDIDIPNNISTRHQASLGEEVEQKIVKKSEKQEEKKVTSKMVLSEKEPDFENMNTFIMQVNKIALSGVTAGEIKIPSYMAEKMMKFLDYPSNFHMEADEKGRLKDTAKVIFDILDGRNNEKDEDVKMYQTDKYVAVVSKKIADLNIEEGDIIRLIKNELGKYTCEIIRKDNQEYNIWENFCTEKIKGSSRKFGIM